MSGGDLDKLPHDQPNHSVRELLRDRDRIRQAMREAVQDAVRTHKLLGHPIVIWRDGKVVVVPPEEIEVDEGTNGAAK